MQGDQALEHSRHFEQRASAHAVGIFLEPVFPVAVSVALANRKEVPNFLNFPIADSPPQPDAPRVVARDHHFQAAGLDVQQVKLFYRRTYGPAADLFNDSDAMVGVNDFIANVEIQIRSTHILAPSRSEGSWGRNAVKLL